MRSSFLLCTVMLVTACGSVVQAPDGGDGDGDGDGDDASDIDAPGTPDAPPGPPDAMLPIDTCSDSDSDGVCDSADVCPGFDDAIDTDTDTVPDGCDECPGFNDLEDVNGNSIPDACDLLQVTVNNKVVGTNYWRGWHVTDGTTAHTSTNDNTITGDYRSGSNSYFVFTLTGFSAHSIKAVTLELELEYYVADATETLSIWDVGTAAATVEADGYNMAVYNDLMTGNMYGQITVNMTQLGTVLSIPLTPQAATDATARLGQDFVVGVHMNTPPGNVRFSSSSEPRIHRVQLSYLPL